MPRTDPVRVIGGHERRMRGMWKRYAGQLTFDLAEVYISEETGHDAQLRIVGLCIEYGLSVQDAKDILSACGILQPLPRETSQDLKRSG